MEKLKIGWIKEKDIYNEIKENLTASTKKRRSKPEILSSRVDIDIPGPGSYALSDTHSTFYSSRSFKFNKSERFLKTQTFPNSELISHSTIGPAKTEEFAFHTLRVPMTSTTSLGAYEDPAENPNSGVHNKTAYGYGSFPKAERKPLLTQSDYYKAGPASYNVTTYSPHNRTGFSFGSRVKSSVGKSLSPGPGAYAPEKVTINANHLSQKGPLILKADNKSAELKAILTRPPFGESYYQTSYYSSFDLKKSPKEKKIFGSAPKLAPLEKSQLLIPGPGAYTIKDPLNEQVGNIKTDYKYFPSFGKPYSSRPWMKEELPGPGEYSLLEPERGKAKIKIGTSKRPGFFDPKQQVEIILNEEKLKRLKRVAKLEALKAEREKMKKPTKPKFVAARKLYFDELIEKAEGGPGFSYDIAKYNQIGSSKGAGAIGKSERKFMKEIEEAKHSPGPGMYDLATKDSTKQGEVKFSTSKRANIFVNKESLTIPGVGSYEVSHKNIGIKGGLIGQSRKDLNEIKGEKQEKDDNIYHFFESLDNKIEEMIERERKKIQQSEY